MDIARISDAEVINGNGASMVETKVAFKIRSPLSEYKAEVLADQFKGQIDSSLLMLEKALKGSGVDVLQTTSIDIVATLSAVDHDTVVSNLTEEEQAEQEENISKKSKKNKKR